MADMIISKSKTKSSVSQCNVSGDFYDALDKKVRELIKAADAGELFDRRQVESQVRRMIKDPRAIAQSEQFIGEWLNVDRLANMQPNAERFPQWNAELAADMRAETLAFFKEIVWKQNRPLADLLNAQLTFAQADNDFALRIYELNGDGTITQMGASDTISDNEYVIYTVPSHYDGREFLVRVHRSRGTVQGAYKMQVDVF